MKNAIKFIAVLILAITVALGYQVQTAWASTMQVTDDSLKEHVLQSEIPVLVNFWASWSGASRYAMPTVEEIAEQYDGKVKVVTVNIDDSPNIAPQYGIESVPTFIIFKNGNMVDRVVGAVPQSTLADTLEKYLKKDE